MGKGEPKNGNTQRRTIYVEEDGPVTDKARKNKETKEERADRKAAEKIERDKAIALRKAAEVGAEAKPKDEVEEVDLSQSVINWP